MPLTPATTAPIGNGPEVESSVTTGAHLAELEALGVAPVGQSSVAIVATAQQVTA